MDRSARFLQMQRKAQVQHIIPESNEQGRRQHASDGCKCMFFTDKTKQVGGSSRSNISNTSTGALPLPAQPRRCVIST
jgi:hypothetical protein